MDIQIVFVCLLFTSTNGLTRSNNEFNSNIFDDQMEYTLGDDSNEYFGDGLEHFFRQVRSLEEDYKNVETVDTQEYFRKLPKSEFARKFRELNRDDIDGELIDFIDKNDQIPARRVRRSADNSDNLDDQKEKKEYQRLVDDGEKPLEIIVLDISNGTEAASGIKGISQLHSDNEDDILKINDFIRFKRNVQEDNATDIDDDRFRAKREKDEKDNKRDIAIKDQWVKQGYPAVNRSPDHQLDENLRAPRVNFVTQRRSESAPLPVYYNYEQNRYRDFPEDYDKGYYARYPRHYQSYQEPYQRHYYRDENSRYPQSQYENDNIGNYYNERPVYKQRRIIYYATLPEVVRSPSPSDLGDRYNYRDTYETDSRYPRPPFPNSGRVVDPYRYRKPYPVDKSRYDEKGYPLKVSADVNVKEIKKNPERRIYIEGDHPYGPYQPMDRY